MLVRRHKGWRCRRRRAGGAAGAATGASRGARFSACPSVRGLTDSAPRPLQAPPEQAAAARARLTALCAAVAEAKAREAAQGTLGRMKDRFGKAFTADERGLPRVWRPADDLAAIALRAKADAARVMGLLVALRLDPAFDDAADSALAAVRSLADDGQRPDAALSGATWEGLPSRVELLSPPNCRTLWRQFENDVTYAIQNARNAQEAASRAASASMPLWAVAAMLALGFDEVLWLLRSPLTLIFLALAALFGRAIWAKLDVAEAMRLGLVPGLMLLATKVLPAALAVVQKLLEAGSEAASPEFSGAASGSGAAAPATLEGGGRSSGAGAAKGDAYRVGEGEASAHESKKDS